jgi:tetratricopeptide (TPR) repeat protein
MRDSARPPSPAPLPVLLQGRRSLADICRESGRYKEAISLGKRALADRERVNGQEHPDTVSARASLASAYRDAKKPKDALPLYERIVADRERLQGPQHPDAILARCDLAVTYLSARKFGQSIPQYERALTDAEEALGSHHPITESVREDLGAAANIARSVLGIDLRTQRPASRSLLDRVELDPVHERVVLDGPGVGGSPAERFEVRFPGAADIVLVDRAERHQFDRVDLDPARPDWVTAARQHFPPLPEPERDGDVARQDVVAQFLAELHLADSTGSASATQRGTRHLIELGAVPAGAGHRRPVRFTAGP